MTTISASAAAAELAFASYANLKLGTNTVDDFLTNNSLIVQALAQSLSTRYVVQAIHDDRVTGAYAVLFRDIQTNRQTLAIRGTEGTADIVADLHLLTGIPAWMSLQYQSLVSKIQQWQLQGLVNAQTSLSGHSLGGYLAAAVKSYFPTSFGDAYTFNAPGLGGALGSVAQFFHSAFGIATQLAGVFALRGTAGLSLIAGTGQQLGQSVPVEIEPAPGAGLANHSIGRINQSLAVFGLFARLDPQLTISNANQMLAAASASSPLGLESLIFGLENALSPNASLLQQGDDQALYERLNSLHASSVVETLQGQLLIRPAGAQLRAVARNDFGAFIALQDLSPAWITGKTAAADATLKGLWETSRSADYAAWTADRSATQPTTFTDDWISDRAAMLGALLSRNAADTDKATGPTNTDYIDVGSQTTVVQRVNGIGINAPASRVVFGTDRDDNSALTGTDNAVGDRLHGMGGNDTLDGRAGDDQLYGGTGSDTYIFTGAWGKDTVIDSDGNSAILINGAAASGGKKVSNRQWVSDNGELTYSLSQGGDLTILRKASSDRILIKGWQGRGNQLGIVLSDTPADPLTAGETSNTYNGDFVARTEPNDAGAITRVNTVGALVSVVDADALRYVTDANGNLQAGSVQPTERPIYNEQGEVIGIETIPSDDARITDNVIFGSAANDAINGLSGNDALGGRDGADVIDGGTGDDLIAGGAGDDNLKGGDGNDVIYSAGELGTDAQQQGANDRWTRWGQPAGTTVRSQGATWGTYTEGNSAVITISGLATSGQDTAQNDVLDGGAGDDTTQGSRIISFYRRRQSKQFATKFIACYEESVRAGGRFDQKTWITEHFGYVPGRNVSVPGAKQ